MVLIVTWSCNSPMAADSFLRVTEYTKGLTWSAIARFTMPFWDQILIPATQEQENAAERFSFHLIGVPFDWRGMISFLLPFFDRRRKAKFCSSIVLDVLQQSLHMFPGVQLKTSPNGLHRLFISEHALVVSAPVPDAAEVLSAGRDDS